MDSQYTKQWQVAGAVHQTRQVIPLQSDYSLKIIGEYLNYVYY